MHHQGCPTSQGRSTRRMSIQHSRPAILSPNISPQDKESVHRVIIGKDYYEPYGLAPEVTLDRTMGFMLSIRQPRHTEGMRRV